MTFSLPVQGHSVELYDDNALLVRNLCRFAQASLDRGALILIATPEHRRAIEDSLEASGRDLSVEIAADRYVSLDAAETLSRFVRGGQLDRTAFMEVVGALVSRVAGKIRPRPLWAYGEMVALLGADGNQQAAIELETLWNELGERFPFYLHCAYPMALFRGIDAAETLSAICGEHSRVIPSHAFMSAGS